MRAFHKLPLIALAVTPLVVGTAPFLRAATPPPKPSADPLAIDAAPQAVAVAVAPGLAKETARRLLLMPYARVTATSLGDVAWDGSPDALRTMQTAHQADLALVGGARLAAGCRAQVFDRIDWSALGRDRFVPSAASDCGVGAYVMATVLAWDRDKLPGSPGWGDFWDVAKHPGRRGLHRAARGNLEVALMADGVAPGDIYRTLRSGDGIDRAFRKLDQLKPYIEWWDQPGQPAQLLSSSKVLLTTAPAETLASGAKLHLGMQWAGSLTEVASFSILASTPHASGVLALLRTAADPVRQAEFARATGFGPAVRAGAALLPPDAEAVSPGAPAHLQAGLPIDEGFWLDNADRLEARFTTWLGR